MKSKSRTKLVSRFPAVKHAGHEAVRHARDLAIQAGKETANGAIERVNARRDFHLPADVRKERIGNQSGKIVYDHFFGRWFEYGTVFIPASSFMRPANRKMRKVFIGELGDNFEGWVRRRARVR